MIEIPRKQAFRTALKVICVAVGLVAIQAVVAGRPSEASEATSTKHRLVNPPEFGLSELVPYPNPARLNTRFRYRLTGAADSVQIKIFDMNGRFVRTLDGTVGAGINDVRWDLDNSEGRGIANGVYLARVTTKGQGRTLHDLVRVAVQR